MDINFNVTMDCNQRCPFCYLNLDGRELDFKTFEKALDSNKFRKVSLSGGEPLLRKELFEFLGEIEKRGLTASIDTNGVLLNKKNANKLAKFKGLELYVSYHKSDSALRNKINYAHKKGISTNAYVALWGSTYAQIDKIFNDLSFIDSILLLYPVNTAGNSNVQMFSAKEWEPMLQQAIKLGENYKFGLFYEPAFAKRNIADLEKVICPAGEDPFIHVDGRNYPCCLLVDTLHGQDTFKPQSFDYHKCKILNVAQPIENEEYRRICPLIFLDARKQKNTLPASLEELNNR